MIILTSFFTGTNSVWLTTLQAWMALAIKMGKVREVLEEDRWTTCKNLMIFKITLSSKTKFRWIQTTWTIILEILIWIITLIIYLKITNNKAMDNINKITSSRTIRGWTIILEIKWITWTAEWITKCRIKILVWTIWTTIITWTIWELITWIIWTLITWTTWIMVEILKMTTLLIILRKVNHLKTSQLEWIKNQITFRIWAWKMNKLQSQLLKEMIRSMMTLNSPMTC